LDIDGPSIPALRADQVKAFVRRKTKEVKLPNKTLRALLQVLADNSVVSQASE